MNLIKKGSDKMRTFSLDTIKVVDIDRVYKDKKDLVILYVNKQEIHYKDLSNEEMEYLIKELKDKSKNKGMFLEVYNGLNEAKNH